MPEFLEPITATAHACLGIQMLGPCKYDPATPPNVYFSLGEAVAALAFTLAVQQLLRPIYQLRLQVRRLSLGRIYALVFAGVFAAGVAALVPSFPILHSWTIGYAIVWELIAAGFFTVAYLATVIAIVRPTRASARTIVRFAQASAKLLTSTDERDHVDYSTDLEQSLLPLMRVAKSEQDWSRLSAFGRFARRKELERAAFARSLLRIISDASFCKTLVTRCPWGVARMLRDIEAARLRVRAVESFVRELARQAIVRDESMMTRELGYQGFAQAPLLSDSLFAQSFTLWAYNPFDFLRVPMNASSATGALKRFNEAARKALTTLIDAGVLDSRVPHSIQDCYEDAWRHVLYARGKPEFRDLPTFELHGGIKLAIEMATRLLHKCPRDRFDGWFASEGEQYRYRHDILEALVDIVFEALSSISSGFRGADDEFWLSAHEAFSSSFPAIGEQPDGMDPFQQRLALKVMEKLKENLSGYYPALIRVLLVCAGPYEHANPQQNRTAFNIIKDAIYTELKRLPELAAKAPDRLSDFLPDHVNLHVATNTLTHTWRGGSQAVTRLNEIRPPAISLFAEELRMSYEDVQRRVAED
jgi:hypothetical protein